MKNRTARTRLAKNTAFMYVRMILLTLITLYTSRMILQKLGIEDYGIYSVVGSIVMMFSSLRSIFSSSTQRFLSFEMGRGADGMLNVVFNTSIYVNIIISAVFVVFVEIVGLWFLNYKINLPANRLFAAHCVFQLSVLSSVISIMTTSFDALIIAHERMDFYAYISIFEAIAKLLIVYMLSIFDVDRLIMYAFLLFLLSLCVQMSNQLFCRFHFQECRLRIIHNKDYLKRMTSFAGWNFLGNTSYSLSQNGLNMVLNYFGGPVVNAARGIAYQVNVAAHQFVSNIVVVIKPYSIKVYAEGNHDKTIEFLFMSAKIFFIIQMSLAIPLVFATNEILKIWLGIIPNYSVIFIQLVLIDSLIRSISPSIDILFMAKGDIKLYQIIESILLFIPLLFSYILLKIGLDYYMVFVCMIIFEVINLIATSIIAKYKVNLPLWKFSKNVLLPCIICFCLACLFYIMVLAYNHELSGKIFCMIIAELSCVIYMYFIGFSNTERNILLSLIKKNGRK